MSIYYKLDQNKKVVTCSLEEWWDHIAGRIPDYSRQVADEEINGKRISTVFLGLDLQWQDDRPLHIFETMVFDEDRRDIYMDRYSTWQEAEEGHKKAMQWVLEGCKVDE